jgi:hypothetical protein
MYPLADLAQGPHSDAVSKRDLLSALNLFYPFLSFSFGIILVNKIDEILKIIDSRPR